MNPVRFKIGKISHHHTIMPEILAYLNDLVKLLESSKQSRRYVINHYRTILIVKRREQCAPITLSEY